MKGIENHEYFGLTEDIVGAGRSCDRTYVS